MLKDVQFKSIYATGHNEPSDFFIDGLKNSINFDLGLGYFRSTGFKVLSVGFARFLLNGGKMRFIINDSLTLKDKGAIIEGQLNLTNEQYEQELLGDFELLATTLSKRDRHFFDCLSWLIASDRLQIIAVKPKKNKVGIVHHKFGIFSDSSGNQVAFNGSVNFSQYALKHNVETLWTEYSWRSEGISKERIEEMIRLFEETWNGDSDVVRKIPIEEVKTAVYNKFPKKTLKELVEQECQLAEEIIKEYELRGSDPHKIEDILRELTAKPRSKSKRIKSEAEDVNKWKHQDEAVAVFLKKKRGVLNMATGTGKTRTALRIADHLIREDSVDSIIISCDGIDLLDQWYGEILNLIFSKELAWWVVRQYKGLHEAEGFRANPIRKILLVSRPKLHLSMKGLNAMEASRTLLIHDEVHKLGSPGNRRELAGLSDNIPYRLGLSATTEREYDQEGTEFIISHIGPIIKQFDLDMAIKKGILVPFNYHPLSYSLTQEDKSSLQGVFARKAALDKAGTPMSDKDYWMSLARVYKTAEGKIPVFHEFLRKNPYILDKCIIFVENKAYGEEILNIVHGFTTEFHSYFDDDHSSVLSKFSSGEIECVLTCHRLSEGIDIPSLNNVILLSSDRARLETIQRIGRCLRTDKKNPGKVANVVDFIRTKDKATATLNSDDERAQFLTGLSKIRPDKVK